MNTNLTLSQAQIVINDCCNKLYYAGRLNKVIKYTQLPRNDQRETRFACVSTIKKHNDIIVITAFVIIIVGLYLSRES